MLTAFHTASICTAFIFAPGASAGDWIQFTNETDQRLVAAAELGVSDTEEKDYAWGDVDRDGDIDLVVVRKEIGSTIGRRRNVLFMNEDGVLTDRTDDYATATDDGSQGFLDLTNDRDVALVDVDGDGWLDIVTVTTFGDGLPKTISHPRIYLNLQDDRGVWQGFRYEEVRFPQLIMAPNFHGVGFGDVTGDGAPDLYFADGGRLEDRLLVNDGNGFFADETEARVTPWLTTGFFSPHAVIADVNHDGYNDILKVDFKNAAADLRVAYNDPENVGFFTQANGEVISNGFGLFVAIGDLNNDELLDLVKADDFFDRYYLNQGNDANGNVDWIGFPLPNSTAGFDSNTVIADLDNDGWNDILIADVDVDIPICSYRLDIHHNLGDPPFVTFEEDVGNLPTNDGGPLRGTHDIAVFDIDGDCWLDLVIGTCAGTTVWINQGEGNICTDCIGDVDGDELVGASDLLLLLAAWGTNPGGPPDLDDDGIVGASDLLILLAAWGPCS